MDETLKKAYVGLNSAQREAVDSIEGPVMVVAGPGTGKTQILTLRIANILEKTDTNPENILALTFTESGAQAMRERLRTYIGTAAYRVAIHTFHGFAENLIKEYPEAFPRVLGGRPATELEKIDLIESILESGSYKYLRPMGNPSYYISPLMGMIANLKKEYITEDGLNSIIGEQEQQLKAMPKVHEKGAHKGKTRGEYTTLEKTIGKNRELLMVYRAYQAGLLADRRYDFEDMINECVEALETNEGLLRSVQETYQYVLADEHQDVNGSQNKILELITHFHEHPNLFVVGDEKQAIYRFQGASLENFLYFEDVYPGTKTITLTENYRSAQGILDLSHTLITEEHGPADELRVSLKAAYDTKAVIEERSFRHEAVEHDWIVDSVKREIDSGQTPEEIAVIVRTNREVEVLTTHLRGAGLAVSPSADSDILSHPITGMVRMLIGAVSRMDDSALFELVHAPFNRLNPNDIFRIMSARSYDQSIVAILSDTSVLKKIGVEKSEEAIALYAILKEARKQMGVVAPHEVLEYLVVESGLLDYVLSAHPVEGSRVLRRIYDEVTEITKQQGAADLGSVRDLFDQYSEHGIALTAPFVSSNSTSVRVMTAHKSKGLEFEVVLIPHLIDSVWSTRKRAEHFKVPLTKHLNELDFSAEDDERRLLYVALTRAKEKLLISHSETSAEGRSLIPSRFLENLNLVEVTTEKEEKEFDPARVFNKEKDRTTIDRNLLLEHLKERGLSPTALNNYLNSPWDYLYRNVLRVPEAPSSALLFGTALHAVLERLTRSFSKEEKLASVSHVKEYLDAALGRLPITTEEFTRLHERGFEALTAYHAHLEEQLETRTEEEVTLKVSFETGLPELPEITLTGMIDRLDFDTKGKTVRLVDYKSGRVKTRGMIEGTTKDSNGEYKRQLVFYALLLELYDKPEWRTRTAVISFIEPNTSGVIKEEVFEITDDEIDALRLEIKQAVQEIAHGTFLDVPCDPLNSSYCNLAGSFS